MKNKTYYIQYTFAVAAGILLFTLLLGDYYTTLKSVFMGGDTAKLFNEATAKIDCVRTITKPIVIASVMALFQYRRDKKVAQTNEIQ